MLDRSLNASPRRRLDDVSRMLEDGKSTSAVETPGFTVTVGERKAVRTSATVGRGCTCGKTSPVESSVATRAGIDDRRD